MLLMYNFHLDVVLYISSWISNCLFLLLLFNFESNCIVSRQCILEIWCLVMLFSV